MSIVVNDEMIAFWPAQAQSIVQHVLAQNAVLEAEVADLKARLNQNSTNSSLPPSSGHPHAKPASRLTHPEAKTRRG